MDDVSASKRIHYVFAALMDEKNSYLNGNIGGRHIIRWRLIHAAHKCDVAESSCYDDRLVPLSQT